MKLHYRILGSGEPLIILHGLFGSSDNWQSLARKYAEHYQVVLVDQRNHGHSSHSDDFSYALMSADLNELYAELNFDKAHILGHSMGGKTAMQFSSDFPGKIGKLIVADIAPKAYPPHHQSILAALNAVQLHPHSTRKDVEEIINAHIAEASTRQFLLKNLYWNDQQHLAWRINIPVLTQAMPEIIGELSLQSFAGPSLFIRGSLSGYVKDSDWPAIQLLFPKSQLITLHGAGHWLHAEQPELFLQHTLDFLAQG